MTSKPVRSAILNIVGVLKQWTSQWTLKTLYWTIVVWCHTIPFFLVPYQIILSTVTPLSTYWNTWTKFWTKHHWEWADEGIRYEVERYTSSSETVRRFLYWLIYQPFSPTIHLAVNHKNAQKLNSTKSNLIQRLNNSPKLFYIIFLHLEVRSYFMWMDQKVGWRKQWKISTTLLIFRVYMIMYCVSVHRSSR